MKTIPLQLTVFTITAAGAPDMRFGPFAPKTAAVMRNASIFDALQPMVESDVTVDYIQVLTLAAPEFDLKGTADLGLRVVPPECYVGHGVDLLPWRHVAVPVKLLHQQEHRYDGGSHGTTGIIRLRDWDAELRYFKQYSMIDNASTVRSLTEDEMQQAERLQRRCMAFSSDEWVTVRSTIMASHDRADAAANDSAPITVRATPCGGLAALIDTSDAPPPCTPAAWHAPIATAK